ncbi:SHOCT domain-containing protein [Microbacterium sp. Leaf159]|uniref:SHOCT domain-containing protein n=1 Tax=Microbacterium sp. Leaf159 TaxID=1736279 RepID=UPI0006F80388|nr:DUF2510 domain-containing protein [Microbacterium sp. Leaf159]KQR39769.1 hypothetical protein ASF80_10395 [Microbacterium sp. Leaf159]
MAEVAAGWYDDGSGRQRWWDGTTWTEHYLDAQPGQAPAVAEARGGAVADWAKNQAQRLTAKHDLANDEDAIWTAVGKPLTGLGAGRYKLTAEYLVFETGTLSSKGQQIRAREIHDVDSSQTMAQKARGVGNITLLARRPSGDEKVVMQDIPNFREGVVAINRVADEARHAQHLRENTSRSSIEYSGAVQTVAPAFAPAASAAPAVSAAGDLNSELERLAGLRAQGILDDEEFTAAKRKLLGL